MKRHDATEIDVRGDALMESATLATRIEVAADGRILLSAEGDIDLATAGILRDALVRALEDSASLVVDLGGVGFIDSSGLNALVWGHWQAQKGGGELRLRRPSPMLRRLMEITALDSLLLIDDDGPLDPHEA
jgi:anti-anti-sigma factor